MIAGVQLLETVGSTIIRVFLLSNLRLNNKIDDRIKKQDKPCKKSRSPRRLFFSKHNSTIKHYRLLFVGRYILGGVATLFKCANACFQRAK